METELKKAIIAKVFENINEFQIINYIIKEFESYIYDEKGEYLIGGERVSRFIDNIIAIIIN